MAIVAALLSLQSEALEGGGSSQFGISPGDGAGSAGGMKIIKGSHLTIAAKLSSDWGPPLRLSLWGHTSSFTVGVFHCGRV